MWRVFWSLGSFEELPKEAKEAWLMLRAIAESGKLEMTKVRRNLVGAKSLEGLGTLGRLGLEGLLLFMYPNFIL